MRAALMQDLEHAMRRSSAQGVIFGQTIANRVGVSNSDMECLDFVILEGRVTAGRLAEVTADIVARRLRLDADPSQDSGP